jgi:HEPN domain-containing protein
LEAGNDNEVAKVTEKISDISDKLSFHDISDNDDDANDEDTEEDSEDEASKAIIRAMQKK